MNVDTYLKMFDLYRKVRDGGDVSEQERIVDALDDLWNQFTDAELAEVWARLREQKNE